MASEDSSWRQDLTARVRRRNKRETESFAGLIESHNKLLRSNASLAERNAALERDILILRHEGASSGGGGGSGSANEAALKAKVQQLQEELTARYKEDAQGSGKQLALANSAREAQSALQQAQSELAVKTDETASAKAAEARLTAELEVSRRDVEVLRSELDGVRVLLTKAEAEVADLTNQNNQLVQRLLDEKNKVAQEMNMMNQLMERMRSSSGGAAGAGGLPPAQAGASAGEQGGEGGAGGGDEQWSSGFGTVVPTEARHVIKAHGTEVNALCFDPSGSTLVTGSSDGAVRLWTPQSATPRGSLNGGTQAVMAVDIDATHTLAASNDRLVRVWTTSSARIRTQLAGHKGNIYAARFLRDGTTVVTGSADRTLKLWALRDGRCTRTLAGGSACNAIDVANGDALASGHQDGAVRIWDLRTSSRVHEISEAHSGQITTVAFSSGDGGARILTNSRDNTLKLFDSRTFDPLCTLTADGYRAGFNWARAAFSPNGRFVVAGSGDGAVFVWDTLTGAVQTTLRSHTGAVASAQWSPTGKQVASVDQNGFLVVWE